MKNKITHIKKVNEVKRCSALLVTDERFWYFLLQMLPVIILPPLSPPPSPILTNTLLLPGTVTLRLCVWSDRLECPHCVVQVAGVCVPGRSPTWWHGAANCQRGGQQTVKRGWFCLPGRDVMSFSVPLRKKGQNKQKQKDPLDFQAGGWWDSERNKPGKGIFSLHGFTDLSWGKTYCQASLWRTVALIYTAAVVGTLDWVWSFLSGKNPKNSLEFSTGLLQASLTGFANSTADYKVLTGCN